MRCGRSTRLDSGVLVWRPASKTLDGHARRGHIRRLDERKRPPKIIFVRQEIDWIARPDAGAAPSWEFAWARKCSSNSARREVAPHPEMPRADRLLPPNPTRPRRGWRICPGLAGSHVVINWQTPRGFELPVAAPTAGPRQRLPVEAFRKGIAFGFPVSTTSRRDLQR